MMTHSSRCFVIAIALLASTLFGQQRNTVDPEVQLRAITQQLLLKGDLKRAIEQYKGLAAGKDRAVAAKALLAIAQCYEKLADPEARNIYTRILKEFADQKDAAAVAQTRLEALRPEATSTRRDQSLRQVWAPVRGSVLGHVSADGRYLPYRDDATGDLAIRDVTTGATRRLTRSTNWKDFYHGDAAISPDGRSIAYRWVNLDGRYELRVLPISGSPSDARILVKSSAEAGYVLIHGWMPDGKRILITRRGADGNYQLSFASLENGFIVGLRSLEWRRPNAAISPDGRYIAYSLEGPDGTTSHDIFVIASDGSQHATLIQNRSDDDYPMWSPDGSEILFFSDRTGINSLWGISVARGKPAGEARLIQSNVGSVMPLGMSRAGAVYYASRKGGNDIYTAGVDAMGRLTSAPKLVAERFLGSNSHPTWSSDGRYLAWQSARTSGRAALVIRTIATGEERDVLLELALANGIPSQVRWFADNSSVLVVAVDSGRPGFGYYRIDVSSGKAELLHRTNTTAIYSRPELSPDGKTIYYVDRDGEAAKLMRFDIAGGKVTELRRSSGRQIFSDPTVSADGRDLAYVQQVRRSDVETDETQVSIHVMPSSGGEPRELLRTNIWRYFGLAWAPDRSRLFYIQREGTTVEEERAVLSSVHLSVGETLRMPMPLQGGVRFPQISTDGRQIAFESLDYTSEVWALENLPLHSSHTK
jgi:TolB protein